MKRTVIYALVGALVCGFWGLILGSVAGSITGWIIEDYWPVQFGISGGADIGSNVGCIGGGIGGLLLFSFWGFLGTPERSVFPPKMLIVHTLLAMSFSAVAVMGCYYLVCYGVAITRGRPFAATVLDHVNLIKFVAPAVMVCGQIVTTLWNWRRKGGSNNPDRL